MPNKLRSALFITIFVFIDLLYPYFVKYLQSAKVQKYLNYSYNFFI
nr:MAG TPA: hypothetical protein [Caudoviricetes sp.]